MNTLPYATDPQTLARARSAFIVTGIVAPLLIGFVGVILMLQWLPELPDPAATHWSGGGAPDGFGPAWTYPVMLGALGVGFPALLAGLVLPSTRKGRWGGSIRFLAAFMTGTTVFLTYALCASVFVQRGLADAADTPDIGFSMLIGVALGAVACAICWFAQPSVDVQPEPLAPVADLELADTTRAVWVRSARMATGGIIAIVFAVLAAIAGTVVAALSGTPTTWVLAIVSVSLVAAVLLFTAVTVTVDSAGLTVRGFLGWPTWRVPVSEIEAVTVSEISPMGDFGGWGIRWGGAGRFGIVMRTGEAIEVRRQGGKTFIVTVDDANRGASLLRAYATRDAG